uniref:Uncharacterized protein n=1 Tax=Tetranychus urticae TaxID=32264 RepID=T1JVF7_TETUR
MEKRFSQIMNRFHHWSRIPLQFCSPALPSHDDINFTHHQFIIIETRFTTNGSDSTFRFCKSYLHHIHQLILIFPSLLIEMIPLVTKLPMLIESMMFPLNDEG